jgi:hypothetical protein
VIAFVDESVRHGGVGTYVLGCVLIPPDKCDELRTELARRPPFHFSNSDTQHRTAMLEWIGATGVATSGYALRGLFVVGGEEEARKLCVARLLQDLLDWDVHDLVMESRRERQNTFDAIAIEAARYAGNAPDPLAYGWRPKAERLLSMADAIAGAVRITAHDRALDEMGTLVRKV